MPERALASTPHPPDTPWVSPLTVAGEEGVASAAADERLAEVLISGQVGERTRYSYRVPPALLDTLAPGHLVEVPFGPRVLQGLVLAISPNRGQVPRLRDIGHLVDPLPCLTLAQIDLAHWLAGYYGCGLDDAVGVMLPPGLDRAQIAEYLPARPLESQSKGVRLTPLQETLLHAAGLQGPATAARLADGHELTEVTRALESLVRRKLLRRQMRLGRAGVSEQSEMVVVLQPAGRDKAPAGIHASGLTASLRGQGVAVHGPARAVLQVQGQRGGLGERQRAVLDYLARHGGEARMADLRSDLGVDTPTVLRLQERHLVQTYARQLRRDPLAHRQIAVHQAPPLTPEQQVVYAPIATALAAGDGTVFLLHGVTGSGKTEVYLRAVAETLALGKGAIVLVPEIGLTPQTVARFAGRFPGQVALLHSKLSDGERYDEWQRIRRGECGVVVGPRSAIFSPFPSVGLIVLDEEHDGSYKQDRTPRYHTREVAAQLARLTGATVILGSATPDVVTYSRADLGEYRLLEMRSRVPITPGYPPTRKQVPEGPLPGAGEGGSGRGRGLPPVQVVDMRLELKAGNRSMFSRALLAALGETLARREQAILFLNRRGNATFVNCRDCGRVVKCLRCDLPFTYHSEGERLRCHRCDAQAEPPTVCRGCGSWRIRYFGIGTQKVEQELATRFPRARVQRYDRDVTGGKFAHEQILDRFARGEADVLIGTQIVAKGLDFPRVTLVGAISADTSLNLPDFRAAERSFQLLTQVAGRAGRASLPGRVIVQTYAPSHYAIVAAAQHDYAAFYRDELRFRRESRYPPFSQLARLTFSARSEEACRQAAHELAEHLEGWLVANPRHGLELIGPAPCFIGKANNSYFWQLVMRGADVHPILEEVPRGWAIDVDPMSML